MPEAYGIENTKKLLAGLNMAAIELVKVLKKGGGALAEVLQVVQDLESNPDFMQAMKDAAAAIPNEGAELKDLSMSEGLQLVVLEAGFIPQVLAAAAGK